MYKRYIALLSALLSSPVYAGGINLTWTAPTSGPVPSGYYIYYGTASRQYGPAIDAGNNLKYTLNNLNPGTYYIAAKSYDTAGNQSIYSNEVTATINNALSIVTVSLPDGSINVPYSANMVASGGSTPYKWSTTGILPAGISLNSTTGALTGTPTAAGTSSFTASVMDAVNSSVNKTLKLTVGTTPSTYSLFPLTAVPAVGDSNDTNAVNLGVKFKSDVSGVVTGIRFYKTKNNTGTHIGNIWSSTGIQLASATFTNETASGWQQVDFATPVSIAANTVYTASYYAPVGHYSYNSNYYTTAMDAAPLHTLVNSGVYLYRSGAGYPTSTWKYNNYWVDVIFKPTQVVSITGVTFTADNAVTTVGSPVVFTPTVTPSNAVISQWNWAFGDKTTDTVRSPSHVYTTPGTYSVSLTVADNAGNAITATYPDMITVIKPIVAKFSSTQSRTVTFTDQSTGPVTSRSWDFGDGSTATVQNPTHTYSAAGSYTVKLTVSGSTGSNTAISTITLQ